METKRACCRWSLLPSHPSFPYLPASELANQLARGGVCQTDDVASVVRRGVVFISRARRDFFILVPLNSSNVLPVNPVELKIGTRGKTCVWHMVSLHHIYSLCPVEGNITLHVAKYVSFLAVLFGEGSSQ